MHTKEELDKAILDLYKDYKDTIKDYKDGFVFLLCGTKVTLFSHISKSFCKKSIETC